VFADIEPATLNLDPQDVAARVTERTRAIVVVHLFGRPAAVEPLLELAAGNPLALLELPVAAVSAAAEDLTAPERVRRAVRRRPASPAARRPG
jgi:dTDP-4-amino-4,6-dideoxygalactose transaminase